MDDDLEVARLRSETARLRDVLGGYWEGGLERLRSVTEADSQTSRRPHGMTPARPDRCTR